VIRVSSAGGKFRKSEIFNLIILQKSCYILPLTTDN
jgi:hypothetical protein